VTEVGFKPRVKERRSYGWAEWWAVYCSWVGS